MRLPPLYALFGKVVKGLDVVDAINDVGTPSGKPKEDVVIESVTITEVLELDDVVTARHDDVAVTTTPSVAVVADDTARADAPPARRRFSSERVRDASVPRSTRTQTQRPLDTRDPVVGAPPRGSIIDVANGRRDLTDRPPTSTRVLIASPK